MDVSEEIAANVQRARTKMVELAKAHAKALMPSFGDGKEDQLTIEGLTQEITGLLRKSEKQLKRLAAAGPSEDSNVRKNVQVSLYFLARTNYTHEVVTDLFPPAYDFLVENTA